LHLFLLGIALTIIAFLIWSLHITTRQGYHHHYYDEQYSDAPKEKSDLSSTIAYAISLVKCKDKQTTTAGLLDAALILRHSVHMTSKRNPESGSKYDYNMIAIVHSQAKNCSDILKTVGFEVMVVDAPIRQNDIRGEHLKKTIHREWCCGHGKFPCVVVLACVVLILEGNVCGRH